MGRRILIVDDNAGFRTTARMLLEAEGFDVVGEAPDGPAAVTAAHELEPDVILLDVEMPGASGYEVAARLTADGTATAVVLVSSRARDECEPLAAESGARGFIPKSELSRASLEALLP